jgi:hypothetical protein
MRSKLFFLAIAAMVVATFSGCTGLEGRSYQKYWWGSSLSYIYDTNPSIPDNIFKDEYYRTEAGTYYMEYQVFNGSWYYMYYTITVDRGDFPMSPGDDSWYELDLNSWGPSLYVHAQTAARDLAAGNSPGGAADSQPVGASVTRLQSRQNLRASGILGRESRAYSHGSISIEYGRLLP